VDPVTISTTIARPRDEVFEYLEDIANHPEFTDHFLVDWHLTREESRGRGAGARFRVAGRGNRFSWGDTTFTVVEAPYRIVEEGSGGKYNRVRTYGVYELHEAGHSLTRVERSFETNPPLLTDRIAEALGSRGFYKRNLARAMRRLQSILEDGEGRGHRATVGGLSDPAMGRR
jgi:uncharacterized protein YndB with AHSA1/START domain